MHVAIVHYHLRPGGVSRVIEHAVRALKPTNVKTVILASEAPQFPGPRDHIQVVPGLVYGKTPPGISAETLADDMERAVLEDFGRPADVWHFHNHCLGKNMILPEAICILASRGHRILLQIHDFAEDGRPANYKALLKHVGHGYAGRLANILYPQNGRVHYATINRRDLEFLADAGVSSTRLHYLPNAVHVDLRHVDPVPAADGRRLFLYPTRAIRRKNMGEFLLWAAAAGPDDRYATTLAPKSPEDMPIYNRWTALSSELKLPVEFAMSTRWPGSFSSLMCSAHCLVSTSAAEGFGLAFLEPWLFGRPLAGRKLPEITGEFEAAGLDLSGMYSRLGIPSDWIDLSEFRGKLIAAWSRVTGAYGRKPSPGDIDVMLRAFIRDDRVDFGRLDESMQEQVIRRVASDPGSRKHMHPSLLEPRSNTVKLRSNVEAIEKHFTLKAYGTHLLHLYQEIMDSPDGHETEIHPGVLLDSFLAPERFMLIRT